MTIDRFHVKTRKHISRVQADSSAPVPSSPLVRRVLLHLHSINPGHFDTPARFDPFTKAGAAVTWIKAGCGWLSMGDQRWRLEPGPCFWFYGTDQTRLFIPDPGQKIITNSFRFSGPGLEGWLEELDTNRQPAFFVRNPRRIYSAYERMLKLARHRPPNWELSVHLVLAEVLGEFLLSRELLTPDKRALPPAIARVLNAIESDPARNWTVPPLAGIAGMSYTAFRVLFKETVGQVPHVYIQRARLDLARQMLADQHLLIKEIAGKLHFSSEHYFSNFFRKHAGISPSLFRKVLLKPPGKSKGKGRNQ